MERLTRERLKELESYVNDLEKRLELFKGANNSARFRLGCVEAELTTLKKDARILADWCSLNGPEYARDAAARIFEATKEEPTK